MAYLSLLKNPAWDSAFFLFLVVAFFFWGMSRGKKKIAIFVLALYVLNLLFRFVPIDQFTSGRSPQEIFLFRAGAFLALLVLLTLLLQRSFRGVGAGVEGLWWEILLLSILSAGFLLSSFFMLAPELLIKNNLLNLSQITLKLFADSAYAKWWTIFPIFGILFL